MPADWGESSPAKSTGPETILDRSKLAETEGGTEPTDAELERAVVDAVTLGAVDVARTLAARLEARKRPAVVVDLAVRRRQR